MAKPEIPNHEDDQRTRAIALKYRLDEMDKKILDLRIKYPSLDSKEIADVLEVGEAAINSRFMKPAMQRAMQEHSKTFFEQLGDLQMMAVKRLKQLVNDSDKDVAIAAIKIAMAPMINQHTFNINNNKNDRAVYEVKLGENGQIMRGFKSTKELLEETKIIDVSSTPKTT
jgi:hypothetical protein